MYNTNWPLNQNKSTSNVDWSALADTWMQQREQQAQWQQVPPPPPPPPQFLISTSLMRPPGPMPMGMPFPPLPPTQLGIAPHHHQLQVGSNTTQESLTMTNIENASWRPPLPPPPPPPPPIMIHSGPQWRPNINNNQPLFPIQSEIAPSFGGRNFWPPNSAGQQAIPPHVPPPVPPPLPPIPSQQSQIPPQFPAASYQHSPVDKRMMNTSFNTSIPSLMDLPSSYKKNPVPPPMPIPPVPVLPVDSTMPTNVPSGGGSGNTNAKRRKIPAWLREELGRIEREKEKKMHNTSNNNNHSNNDSSSKFDDDDDEEEETHNRTFNASLTAFNDDDDDDNDDEENEQDDDGEPSSTQISSTPIVNRRSRFDDDKSTDPQLNVSAISKRMHPSSPSPPPTTTTTTLIEDDPIDKEEQFMMKLRRALTELLLEVTNEELASLAKEVYLNCKAESSTPVIRKASGLSSLMQSFSGTDSDDEEEKSIQTIVKTTVITKSPIQPTSIKADNDKSISKSSSKMSDDDTKTNKTKKKKSTRDRSPSKKHHHKKHRHHSSSSSNSSQSSSQKKKKSSNHDSYSEHKKYDDRARKH